MQAAHECRIASRLSLQIYSDGLAQVDPSRDALNPEKGSLLGPCLVAPQEIPGLSMRCLDIPASQHDSWQESIIDQVIKESAVDSEHVLTALRAGGRFTEELFELPEIVRGLPRLRYGATVLITGGVGGLGLRIAELLYDIRKVRLVLTSRWQAPPRDEWHEYGDEDTKIGRALGVLSRLVAQQAELLIIKADVRSREDMQRVIQEIKPSVWSHTRCYPYCGDPGRWSGLAKNA